MMELELDNFLKVLSFMMRKISSKSETILVSFLTLPLSNRALRPIRVFRLSSMCFRLTWFWITIKLLFTMCRVYLLREEDKENTLRFLNQKFMILRLKEPSLSQPEPNQVRFPKLTWFPRSKTLSIET